MEIPDTYDIDDLPVTLLEGPALLTEYENTKNLLLQIGEALNPTTQQGRDLHSRRTALLVEIARRGYR